jgi:MFS family permease
MGAPRTLLEKILPDAGLPRRLALQSAVFAVGNGTYKTGSVVFFSVYVGLPAVQIGIGLSFAGFLALIGSLPFGHVADRIGGKRAWVLGASAGAVSFALYPLAGTFWSFLVVLGAATLAEVFAGAGRLVYTAAALPAETRVRTMAFTRAYLNVGFTAGAGIGAAALALNSRAGLVALVLVNAAGMVVNALTVARMPDAVAEPAATDGPRPSPWGVLRDHPYTVLAAIIGMMMLHSTLWGEVLPLWAITMTDTSKPVLGGLFALNTILAITLQVRATRGADTLRGSTRLYRIAALATAVACPVAALSGMTHGWVTIAVLVLAVVLMTATELWSSAAVWFFQTDVPPPAQRGLYLGASRSVGGVAAMIGPAALTWLAVTTGGWGWWVIAALFVAIAVVVQPVVSWVDRTPRNGAVSPSVRAG